MALHSTDVIQLGRLGSLFLGLMFRSGATLHARLLPDNQPLVYRAADMRVCNGRIAAAGERRQRKLRQPQ